MEFWLLEDGIKEKLTEEHTFRSAGQIHSGGYSET